VTIANPLLLKGPLRVKVDGKPQPDFPAVPGGFVIRDLPAGPRAIALEAERLAPGGAKYLDEKAVQLVAGEVKDLSFTIPSAPAQPPPAPQPSA